MSSLRNSYDRVALSEEFFLFRNLTDDGLIDGNQESNVDGSVTPVKFFTQPPEDRFYSIRTAAIHVSDSGSVKIDDYGSISGPLPNGLVFYVLINGEERILGPGFKSNRDLSELGPIITRQNYSNVSTITYEFDISPIAKRGIQLVGSRGDQFGIIVRDDLSTLVSHVVAIKGSNRKRKIS